MINYFEVYTFCDQPTTCAKCGSRTEIISDLSHTTEQTQIHKCFIHTCDYEFVVQTEEKNITKNFAK